MSQNSDYMNSQALFYVLDGNEPTYFPKKLASIIPKLKIK